MTDDEPLDLATVAEDHDAIELLRRRLLQEAGSELRVAADTDAAVLLLRDLLRDVDDGLPELLPVPGRRGSTVVSIAGERSAERQLARRGALVAAMAAGLVSLGGVAAASTMAPAGAPLHGLGEAVRSAAGMVVGAVSLPERTASPATGAAGGAEAARVLAPGSEVSTTARSQAAARQVTALLDAAQQLLAEGRTGPASARLDNAERHLSDVLPSAAAPLAARLEQLRQQVTAAAADTSGTGNRQQEPVQHDEPQEQGPAKQAPPEQVGPPQGPAKQAPSKQERPKQERPERERPEQERPEQEPAPRDAPGSSPGKGEAPQLRDRPAQLSKDASTKPRA